MNDNDMHTDKILIILATIHNLNFLSLSFELHFGKYKIIQTDCISRQIMIHLATKKRE